MDQTDDPNHQEGHDLTPGQTRLRDNFRLALKDANDLSKQTLKADVELLESLIRRNDEATAPPGT